jgi:hypothetical protein
VTENSDIKIHKIEIDDVYKQTAFDKIKKAVRGNGFDPEKIALNRFEGEVLQFQAETMIEMSTSIIEKSIPGRMQGPTIADSEATVKALIQRDYLKARDDASLIESIRNVFINRPDKGFAQDKLTVPLKTWRRSYVIYIPCQSCKSMGTNPCTRCGGAGKQNCHNCNGSQTVMDSHNNRITCIVCAGRGKISCSACRQSGKMQCPPCGGNGVITCHNCKGLAWISHFQEATLEASTSFDYPRNKLPANIVVLIDKEKEKLAEHAEIHILPASASTPVINADNEDKMRDIAHANHNKIFRVPLIYNVILPYSHMEYGIKGKTYYTFLFGTKGMLSHVSPFLDDLLAEPLRKLDDAASGRGNVAHNLKAAARYKTARQAILLSLQYSSWRATAMLLKANPLGLSEETAKIMIANADAGIKSIIRKPRLVGLGLALPLCIGLLGAYFLSPARKLLMEQHAHQIPDFIIDLGVLALTTYLGLIFIQTIAGYSLKKALFDILPKDKKNMPLSSKAGWAITTAHIGLCLSGFIALLEYMRQIMHNSPDWHAQLLSNISHYLQLLNGNF